MAERRRWSLGSSVTIVERTIMSQIAPRDVPRHVFKLLWKQGARHKDKVARATARRVVIVAMEEPVEAATDALPLAQESENRLRKTKWCAR